MSYDTVPNWHRKIAVQAPSLDTIVLSDLIKVKRVEQNLNVLTPLPAYTPLCHLINPR